jgi:hypothetical protein
MKHILYTIGALAFGAALGFASMARAEGPVQLPDGDTSSLGTETVLKDSPFMLRCTDAKTFTDTAKRLKAKGMIVGNDMFDNTLVMVFKYEDGSINFVRSDKQGKTLCMFGAISEPDINLGVVMGGNKEYDN